MVEKSLGIIFGRWSNEIQKFRLSHKGRHKSIWNNRMMSLASIGVLISCLLITGAAVITSMNASSLISSIGDTNMITVYLDPQISDVDALKLELNSIYLIMLNQANFIQNQKLLKIITKCLAMIFMQICKAKIIPCHTHIK